MSSELEKGIMRYVDACIDNAPYTQIYTAIVKSIQTNNTCTITLNGKDYVGIKIIGIVWVNKTVRVFVPNNQYNNMFIISESSGSSSDTLTSYTPTASNLGTITTHIAMVRVGSGVARYKLSAICGTWTAGTDYTLCTLTSAYRPSVAIEKRIEVYQSTTTTMFVKLTINTNGTVVVNPPVAMSALAIFIDETYLL